MEETNITDSFNTVKESPDADDADEGIDLSNSNADKVSESSESKSELEGASENIDNENVSEKDNCIDNSSQEYNKVAEESDSDDEEMFRKKPLQRKKMIVSDDEDSDEPLSQVSKISNKESESSQKSVIESNKSDDSDDELLSAKDTKKKKKRIINSDSEDDSDMEMFSKSDQSQSQETKPSYNRNIFDTETSDEEERRSHHSDEENQMEMSKSKKKSNEKKPKEPTAKDREKERLEIASESQRMQREATFSLPYHKPKQRTLAEFLNRRKSSAPLANTMKGSLKASMRNPEILKQLESRKKDVEEFYKSDDENAEDPEDGEWKPGMEPKRSDSDKDSDDEDMETEAKKNISEAKIESNKAEILLDGNEGAEQSSNDIVSSELKDEKIDNIPGAILDEDELPDIDKNPSEIICTSKEENMQIEVSKSKEEQIKLSEDKVANELITDTSKSEMTSISSAKILVNDSGIQSGASSSNEDQDSNDATVVKATNDDSEIIAETNTQGSKITLAESIENSNYSLQGTQSTQNIENNESKINTPKMAIFATKVPTCDLKVTPKLGLGASSGDFIDLDEDTTPKDKAGLDSFLNRFIKHSKTRRAKVGKRQVNMSVVQKVKGADGQENLESSSISIELEEDEDHTITDEIPGAKRVTLKTALKAKMREQREQERLRRVKEKKFMDSEDVEGEDAILDDEAETDEEETDYETESEPEENDIVITDKKRKKNKFLDEEADEDEMDDAGDENEKDDAGIDNDDDDSNDTVVLGSRPNKKHNVGEDDEEDSDTNNEDLHLEWENTQDVNKGLHRTETQDMFESQLNDKHPKKIESADKDSSMTSMDSSFEFFGSVIPAHQPGGGLKNPQRSHLNSESQDISNTGFLTPLLKQKTESFGSVSKGCDLSLPFENSQELCSTQRVSVNKEESQSPTRVSLQLSQDSNSQFETKESNSSPGAKLRLNFVGATQTQQGTADELAGLCSGQFTGKTQDKKESNLYDDDDDDMADTQNIDDLMGLCSGRFNTQPSTDADNKRKGSSGAFSELFDSEKKCTLEDDDLVGLCTGKFTTQKEPSESTIDEVTKEGENSDAESKPRTMIIDSDDEDLIKKINNKDQKKQKRKRKRIVAFGSDDEDDNAVNFVPDFDDEEMPKKEKNSLFKDKAAGGIRKDFLDAEAELSGSEDEVSDDEIEGEHDDFMEMEAGDADNYDDDELRDQVGRAHMKAEMDADKKRIRLLQEMYLEDGDLHSTEGRQRSFRWKNNDDDNDDSNQRAASDEEDHKEEEAEDAEWRKQRFEREKFLQEKEAEKKDDENEPEMFKIRAHLVRTTSLISTKREPLKPSNPQVAPVNNHAPNTVSSQPTVSSNPFCMPTKRGSFLSRNKSTLAKIAELTKDKGNTVGGAKQGGNFVFQQLSAEEVEVKKELAETKLNRSITAPAMKRARLDRSFFSLDETKQKSSLFKHL